MLHCHSGVASVVFNGCARTTAIVLVLAGSTIVAAKYYAVNRGQVAAYAG